MHVNKSGYRLTAIVLLSLILSTFKGFAQDQQPVSSIMDAGYSGRYPTRGFTNNAPQPQPGPDGLWSSPDQPSARLFGGSGLAPLTTRTDTFGYTWNDLASPSWIDASAGTDSGMSASIDQAGPVDIGFTFKFYEITSSRLYISRHGFVSLSGQFTSRSQSAIPNPETPNHVIAPNWVPIDNIQGYIRYLIGGEAPNRWFVVEWNRVMSKTSEYTFELILHENGDIDFQYGAMAIPGSYCQSSGIENTNGLDGLSTSSWCYPIATNRAVHITRPASSARVGIYSLYQGSLNTPGTTASFLILLHNNGDLGTDTYELNPVSAWPLSLYEGDGTTPLSDKDGDGVLETDPIAQAYGTSFVATVQIPPGTDVGASNTADLTICSALNAAICKTVHLQTAVPSSFVQIYRDGTNGNINLYAAQPGGQYFNQEPSFSGLKWGYRPAIAEAPNGNFVIVAQTGGRCLPGNCASLSNDLEFALRDKRGGMVLAAHTLTDNTTATLGTWDYDPAVAVAPNGQIGVIWYRVLSQNATNLSPTNINIYFAVLGPTGNIVLGPTNLTNNSVWGNINGLNVPQFSSPKIAATGDNQFALAWRQSYYGTPTGGCSSGCAVDDLYYTVRAANGDLVRGITQFTNDTAGWENGYYDPNLTALAGNRLLMTWSSSWKVNYAVLDSAGNIVKDKTTLNDSWDNNINQFPDGVQLSNGKILVAWTTSENSLTSYIRFALLDESYNRSAGPISLSNPATALTGDAYVSVSADRAGRAVLTWMDRANMQRRNLYYALVDHTGAIVTQPIIFRTTHTSINVETSFTGYGNTSYSSFTPGVDTALTCKPLLGSVPANTARADVKFDNLGQNVAAGVTITATLADGLTYQGANMDSSFNPTIVGNTITWHLPDLYFLWGSHFVMTIGIPPAAAKGAHFPVSFTIASNVEDAYPANNTAAIEVMAPLQTFLPALRR